MKLRSIYLQHYRVLKEFSLPFASSEHESVLDRVAPRDYKLDLIVGVNGTGKSTLLRAIAEIFRRIYTGARVPFGFAITYDLQNFTTNTITRVMITNLSDLDTEEPPQSVKEGQLRISIDEGPIEFKDAAQIERRLLPPLIVAFTTGDEREWELLKDESSDDENRLSSLLPGRDTPLIKEELAQWFLSELPNDPMSEQAQTASTIETDQFLLIKEPYLPLVILCSLLDDLNRIQQRAIDEGDDPEYTTGQLHKILAACNIKALRGFSLKLRMNREALSAPDYQFIRELASFAQTLQMGSDYLLVFDLSRTDLPGLLRMRGNSLDLFRALIRLCETQHGNQPILTKVNLFLERISGRKRWEQEERNIPRSPLHLLDWLSDGERSFLGRLCLLSLLGSGRQEALVLLDEPEVHFNDYWKRQLVTMIDSSLGEQYCHVLMTTHSSITLSDVLDRDIWVLRRDGHQTKTAEPPALRTLGTDPSDIMVYVFDAENATGAHGTALIEQRLNVIARFRNADEEEAKRQKREALKELIQLMGPSDLRFLVRRELHALEGGDEE